MVAPVSFRPSQRVPMRRNLYRLILLLPLVTMVPLGAAAAADATAFMNDLGTNVLRIINDKQQTEVQRKEQFHVLVDKAFDIPKIAQFVLGRYWRGATDAEKQAFNTAFETYMIEVYWSRFSSYSGESFRVTGQQNEGNGTILVTTEIMRSSGQPSVKVSWSLMQQGDVYKIRDASLEGISQALTYRDEFASFIERNGGQVSGLINHLNERAKG
jgi:phospholipid transport system substrate-binding protein